MYKFKVIPIMMLSLIIMSCDTNQSQSTLIQNGIKDFEALIKLEVDIKNVDWEITSMPEDVTTNDLGEPHRIHAVIKLDSLNMAKLTSISQTAKRVNDEVYLNPSRVRNWYPKKIKNLYFKEGDFYRLKKEALNSESIIDTSKELYHGYYVIVDENTIFLSVYTSR